jgi:hypothetical protein
MISAPAIAEFNTKAVTNVVVDALVELLMLLADLVAKSEFDKAEE